jgi:hypothetical protein
MARTEARLMVSIWEDPDFLALSATAQRLFMFLISQPDLAHDGVIPLRERRWSKKAAGMTAAQVAADLDELSATRFVVVDEDTEELLVRSFIRRDKVYRQPNVLRSARDHLSTVSSAAIRDSVGAELARIQEEAEDIPEGSKGVLMGMVEAFANPSRNPSANPSGMSLRGRQDDPLRKAASDSGDQESPESTPHSAEPVDNSLTSTVKGSANPSAKGTGLRPGERGVVTVVSTGSPSPFPLSSSPGPREPAARAPRAQTRERGTRIPDDFAVTPEMVTWARENAPQVNGGYETAKFVDYWRAKAGRDATKTDWIGTWRNWMRKAQEDTTRGGRGVTTGANRHTAQRHDNPFAEAAS